MTFNIFYLNNEQERLLWHSVKCVKGGRISFGLKLNLSANTWINGKIKSKTTSWLNFILFI